MAVFNLFVNYLRLKVTKTQLFWAQQSASVMSQRRSACVAKVPNASWAYPFLLFASKEWTSTVMPWGAQSWCSVKKHVVEELPPLIVLLFVSSNILWCSAGLCSWLMSVVCFRPVQHDVWRRVSTHQLWFPQLRRSWGHQWKVSGLGLEVVSRKWTE